MDIIRTTRLKITLDLDCAARTITAWTDACNWISQVAFANGCLSNAIKLHRLTYVAVRIQFSLSAQVTASAVKTVASKYAGLRRQKRIPFRPVHFGRNAVILQGGVRGRDFSFTKTGLSVWTLDGRVKAVPYWGEPKLAEYIACWKLGDARLFVRKKKVYLSVSFHREAPDLDRPTDAVIGVDRGINHLAVITDGRRQQFFGGRHVLHVRDRYLSTRASLQRKKAQTPTHSLRRVLKRLSGRETRFMTDVNHQISKHIVTFAQQTGNPTIALEKLDGIRNRRMRKSQRRNLHRWSFCQLEQFIRYKAETVGSEVIEIDPAYTSQGCSRCGYTMRANRKGPNFCCGSCGHALHADLNGARNIRLRGLLARQALSQDGRLSLRPKTRFDDSG